MGFHQASAPNGWLKANGAAVSRTVYANLFAAIGTSAGAGDGVTTFNLPDWRGEFMRGWDDGRGIDAGRTIGSWQADSFKSHQHISPWSQDAIGAGIALLTGSALYAGTISSNGGTGVGFRDVASGENASTEAEEHVMNTSATGGSETRPRNRAALICIKY